MEHMADHVHMFGAGTETLLPLGRRSDAVVIDLSVEINNNATGSCAAVGINSTGSISLSFHGTIDGPFIHFY